MWVKGKSGRINPLIDRPSRPISWLNHSEILVISGSIIRLFPAHPTAILTRKINAQPSLKPGTARGTDEAMDVLLGFSLAAPPNPHLLVRGLCNASPGLVHPGLPLARYSNGLKESL